MSLSGGPSILVMSSAAVFSTRTTSTAIRSNSGKKMALGREEPSGSGEAASLEHNPPVASSSTISREEKHRQRSQSLPSFDSQTTQWFPSPSSAFRTPPSNEAEILRDLISRERVKRDARLAKHRSSGNLVDSRRPASAGPHSAGLPAVPDCNESSSLASKNPAEQSTADRSPTTTTPPHSPSQSDETPVPTPTSSAIALHGFSQISEENEQPSSPVKSPAPPLSRSASQQQPPSRPASSYQTYLPDLDHPKTDTARRLSLSASRRNSRMSIHSNSSTPFSTPSTPFEDDTEMLGDCTLCDEDQVPVTVRDYGFPTDDPRYIGLPAPADSAASMHSAQSDTSSRVGLGGHLLPEGVFDDSSSESGVGATPEGSNSTFSWDFVPQSSDSNAAMLSPTGDVPFNPPSSKDLGFSDSDADSEDERATVRAQDDATSAGMDDIPEGGALYVAAYPFVPEAAQEMSLYVGEVVKVLERLCEGWVICVRQQLADDGSGEWVDAVETGLTPETYLQRYDLFSNQFDRLGLDDSTSSGGGGGGGGDGGVGVGDDNRAQEVTKGDAAEHHEQQQQQQQST